MLDRLKRRNVITLLGAAVTAPALLWPVAARAQQASKLPTVGFLGSGTASNQGPWAAVFAQRLRELGWTEGRTIHIEYRWAESRRERLAEIAKEFVERKVDVILAVGTEAALAAKQATTIIPIVFPVAGDPIADQLVASLARPGGNVTGLSNQASDLAAKRLEILREILPALRRVAVMSNADSPNAATESAELRAAIASLDLEVVPVPVRRAQEIMAAFETLKRRADALYVVGDPLMNTNRLRINTLALAAHVPTMFVQRDYVAAAGLISYGPNYLDLNRRAAEFVDKILRGTKPADIPVEQPTKFDLVINLVTAKALGIEIPSTLLARADEVIE
jgi:putative ABC transport system substrate-binding protein